MKQEKTYSQEQYNEIKKYWDDFKKNIKHSNRFFIGNEIITILNKLKRIEEKRDQDDSLAVTLSPMLGDLHLYRARIGDYTDEKKYEENELLNPPSSFVKSGRCNPSGISYLYLASDIDTAMHEVRPNIGDNVTIAEVSVNPKNILSFNILSKTNNIYESRKLKTYDVEAIVDIINKDLSSVVTVNQDVEYLPFQFLAEYIKNRGFDCFSYSSSITKGTNYVMFDSSNAKVISRNLYKINKVKCEYEKL